MAMVRERLGKLDRWIRQQPLVTPAFKKRREITSSRSTCVGTNKMKQKPAFKRTRCVQGATESVTFIDRRLERAEIREMPHSWLLRGG